MKSAYELAMERLAKESPARKLTAAEKRQLAEIDSRYRARIAEREIFLRGEIARAAQNGDPETMAQLERQLTSERKSLEDECEEKKEKIRVGEGKTE
jgi:hypothetical protein